MSASAVDRKKLFYGNHFVRHLGYNSFSKGFQ